MPWEIYYETNDINVYLGRQRGEEFDQTETEGGEGGGVQTETEGREEFKLRQRGERGEEFKLRQRGERGEEFNEQVFLNVQHFGA